MSRQRLFATLIITLTSLISWLLAEFVLNYYQQQINNHSIITPGLLQYHSQFGWTLSKQWQGQHQHHDFDVTYNTDADGYRQSAPPINKTTRQGLVAVLGDSFTFGIGVNDDETFVSHLNQSVDRYPFINLGVPGYSTDQQYLLMKYRQSRLKASHYIVVFYLGNDLLDINLPYPLQAEQAKPFFTYNPDQGLQQQNYPVPKTPKPQTDRAKTPANIAYGLTLPYQRIFDRALSHSAILSRLIDTQSIPDGYEAKIQGYLTNRLKTQVELLAALIKELQQQSLSREATLSIALMPGRSYISTPSSYGAALQEFARSTAVEIASELKLDTIDIATALRTLQPTREQALYHPNEGHLTAYGHQQVATIIGEHIANKDR